MEPGVTRAVLLAHGYKCRYCGGVADTADHIVPRNLGGSDHHRNLTAACQPCNSRKGAQRLPAELESELKIEAFILVPFVDEALASYKAARKVAAKRPSVRIDPLSLTQWSRQGRK